MRARGQPVRSVSVPLDGDGRLVTGLMEPITELPETVRVAGSQPPP